MRVTICAKKYQNCRRVILTLLLLGKLASTASAQAHTPDLNNGKNSMDTAVFKWATDYGRNHPERDSVISDSIFRYLRRYYKAHQMSRE